MRQKKLGIESHADEAGNLWLPSDAPEGEILLCSHMDKVGIANAAAVEGDRVRGRLDDALGTSIIMGALKKACVHPCYSRPKKRLEDMDLNMPLNLSKMEKKKTKTRPHPRRISFGRTRRGAADVYFFIRSEIPKKNPLKPLKKS